MLQLTPRLYKRNMEWSLLPYNKIDNVNVTPISNAIGIDKTDFHIENFTRAIVGNGEYDLPLSDNVTPTYWRYMYNKFRSTLYGNNEYAKARMECIMGAGYREVKTDTAISGIPEVEITLSGTSSVIERGGSTYDVYPSLESLKSLSFSLSTWIKNNKTMTNNTLTGDYSGGSFSMNPWVRKVVPSDPSSPQMNLPTYNDILTTWNSVPDNAGRIGTSREAWSEYNSFGNEGNDVFSMYPVNAPTSMDDDSILRARNSMLVMSNLTLPIECNVSKKDDYTFVVRWVAPIKIAYIAASRNHNIAKVFYDADNYAYVDDIENVAITLRGRAYDTDTTNVHLSRSTNEKHPLKIDFSEALTLQSYSSLSDAIDVFDSSSIWPGYYTAADGNIYVQLFCFTSDYISVEPGDLITTRKCTQNDASGQPVRSIVYFDSSKNVIGSDYLKTDVYTVRIPDAVAYIKVNGNSDDIAHEVFYVNKQTPYLWTDTIPYAILDKYVQGKYIVQCDVLASWALQNNIKANTQMQVKLQNGKYIQRGDSICTFEVKNIEKRFKDSEFIYALKLMEV